MEKSDVTAYFERAKGARCQGTDLSVPPESHKKQGLQPLLLLAGNSLEIVSGTFLKTAATSWLRKTKIRAYPIFISTISAAILSGLITSFPTEIGRLKRLGPAEPGLK